VEWARRWWGQPDRYDWMVGYLDHRGILAPYRAIAAGLIASLAVVPSLMVLSPMGPSGNAGRGASLAVTIVVIVMAVTWMVRRALRPSRLQSKVFSIVCTGCVAAMCLVQPQPLVGLLGCAAFAVLATYISFFHTAGYMTVNLVASTGTAALLGHRIVATTGDYSLALSALIVLTALNLAVPLAVQSLMLALTVDLSSADRDPLTGLLNRRAFYRGATEMLVSHRKNPEGLYLVVTMVDLDDFKRLNDDHGHTVGDRALIAVADAIRENFGPHSVVCRAGGEEFVIADLSPETAMIDTAWRLRDAIAALPFTVTASIGTASIDLVDAYSSSIHHTISELIEWADQAMYAAKRSGGNRAQHYSPPGSPCS
jgi:diguanylate cyclase (GGDEF)-like protein